MKWSIKVGTFRGISVYLHATFLVLLGWILFSHLLAGHGMGSALAGALFIVLLFTCVVLHEFGHALTAQRYGIQTRDIVLYPIGGVARLERIPRDPRQELWIALAGPAVNVVIAAVLYLLLAAGHAQSVDLPTQVVGGNMVSKLLWTNISLAVFNLLPAFPMDGGRVLRAFLATRMEYGRATDLAASIGQGMAFLFGLLGLLFNPFLLFIAFFVYMGAAAEASTVQAELAFRGMPTRVAMMTRFEILTPDDPLSRAVQLLLAGAQHDFPVLQDQEVVGVLTRPRLFEALGQSGPSARVGDTLQPAPDAAHPEEALETVFQRMREDETPLLPVVEEGQLVGLITLENIGEFLMLREALSGKGRGRSAPASSGPEAAAHAPVRPNPGTRARI